MQFLHSPHHLYFLTVTQHYSFFTPHIISTVNSYTALQFLHSPHYLYCQQLHSITVSPLPTLPLLSTVTQHCSFSTPHTTSTVNSYTALHFLHSSHYLYCQQLHSITLSPLLTLPLLSTVTQHYSFPTPHTTSTVNSYTALQFLHSPHHLYLSTVTQHYTFSTPHTISTVNSYTALVSPLPTLPLLSTVTQHCTFSTPHTTSTVNSYTALQFLHSPHYLYFLSYTALQFLHSPTLPLLLNSYTALQFLHSPTLPLLLNSYTALQFLHSPTLPHWPSG